MKNLRFPTRFGISSMMFLSLAFIILMHNVALASEMRVTIKAEWIPNYQEFDGCYRRTVNPDGVQLYVSGLPAILNSHDYNIIEQVLNDIKSNIPQMLVSLCFGTSQISMQAIASMFGQSINGRLKEGLSYTIGVRPVVHYGSWRNMCNPADWF